MKRLYRGRPAVERELGLPVACDDNTVRYSPAMVQIGEKVQLLSQIGDYPVGTEAIVKSVAGDTCDIEIDGHVLTIDCNAVAVTTDRFANPS